MKILFGHLKHFVSSLYGFLICQLIIFSTLTFFNVPWHICFVVDTKINNFQFVLQTKKHLRARLYIGQDDFTHTRTTLSSNFVRYFIAPLNVNYHLEHHLFMFCPWYNLPKAHEMLKEKDFYKDLEIENGYFNVFKKVII